MVVSPKDRAFGPEHYATSASAVRHESRILRLIVEEKIY
jgi:hypothetical protein